VGRESRSGACLSWQRYPDGRGFSLPRPVALYGEITVDRGSPFGLRVQLLRDGRVVSSDVTHPSESPFYGQRDVGTYRVSAATEGEYELVVKYGPTVVLSERIELPPIRYSSRKDEIRLSQFRQIPLCA
jgi:hypothetical protein